LPPVLRAGRHEWFRRGVVWGSAAALAAAPFLWWLVAPWAAVLALVATQTPFWAATVMPNCRWCEPVVRAFTTDRREVWLTLDDGPDPEETPRVLALLARRGIKAGFFLIGERARRHPELARQIAAGGHRIGNHTHTHPVGRFWGLPPRSLAREIDACSAALTDAGIVPPRMFRAPVGLASPLLFPLLHRRGLRTVGWSCRGFDVVTADADKVVARILRRVRPGAIILLHPEQTARAGAGRRLECLEKLLAALEQAGWRCVLPAEESWRSR
jgi:peptidoglycan/xylan/chitin deacetylase (PgdA/CDA1 family)